MAMRGQDHLIDIRHAVFQHGNNLDIFLRQGVPNSIGNIDCGRSSFNRHLYTLTQKISICSGRILS